MESALVRSTELVLNVVNLIFALVCVIESALIFKIISNKKFRQNLRKIPISIMELVSSWRKIIMAIVFFAIMQVYYLLAKYGIREVSLAYELFVSAFLFLMIYGLFGYYKALKKVQENIFVE